MQWADPREGQRASLLRQWLRRDLSQYLARCAAALPPSAVPPPTAAQPPAVPASAGAAGEAAVAGGSAAQREELPFAVCLASREGDVSAVSEWLLRGGDVNAPAADSGAPRVRCLPPSPLLLACSLRALLPAPRASLSSLAQTHGVVCELYHGATGPSPSGLQARCSSMRRSPARWR